MAAFVTAMLLQSAKLYKIPDILCLKGQKTIKTSFILRQHGSCRLKDAKFSSKNLDYCWKITIFAKNQRFNTIVGVVGHACAALASPTSLNFKNRNNIQL